MNIPIGLIAAVLVLKTVPESKGPRARGYDPVVIVSTALGLALIVFALRPEPRTVLVSATLDF